jgi:hypothetical protein
MIPTLGRGGLGRGSQAQLAGDSPGVLHLHFDGSNGAPTFLDSSPYNRTATVNGGAQLSTTGPKYGTACGVFDGTGDNVTYPTSNEFEFGSGLFTIKGWAYANVNNAVKFIVSNLALNEFGVTNGWYLVTSASGKLVFEAAAASSTAFLLVGATTIPTATWFSFAVTGDGSTARLFYEGLVDASVAQSSIGTSGGPLYVGSKASEDGTRDWNGRLDELKIKKGVCDFTSNYTPSGPF